jgi:hypothetical protein
MGYVARIYKGKFWSGIASEMLTLYLTHDHKHNLLLVTQNGLLLQGDEAARA